MPNIAVIDDDESVRDTIAVLLENEGFQTLTAADGRTGYEMILQSKPDLAIVDLRLPEMTGAEVCKQVRASGDKTPIIILSAVGEEVDKVLLLETGADDYVVKPFGTRELLARIRAVLRRSNSESSKTLSFGDVTVDLERRMVTRAGYEVKLTPAEYNLLTYFLNHPDCALSRDRILNAVWGYESYPTTRTVDAHIVRLRQKLEPEPGQPRHFVTIHGVGYRFVA